MPRNPDDKQTYLDIEVEVSANRGLFADHYLDDILPNTPDWKCDEIALSVFQSIKQIYHQHAVRFKRDTNEFQTENDFIQPVLDVLWGHGCYQVQCHITVPDGHRQTDYAFFPDPETRDFADTHKNSQQFWPKAVALGDAKKWCDSLDKRRPSDGSPSNQILNYLYHAKVRWGILTNGRIWRLYEQDKSRQGGVYYEVNLEAIIKQDNIEVFKRFFLFFRREAFVPDASETCFIDRVYDGSVDYATTVGERLKESVYDALRNLMNGFFAVESNGLDRTRSEDLKLVHAQSLILLYRILFILYAEDRGLLDPEEPYYKNLSLRTLQKDINNRLKRGSPPFIEQSFEYWNSLGSIFEIIDVGLSIGTTQRIPAYNGGLFSSGNYPYITCDNDSSIQPWSIRDEHLAWTIDLLAYSHEKWDEAGEKDIDYTSLEVRHLGSIYEGLLELQPSISIEPLVEIYDKDLKTTVFGSAVENPNAPRIRNQNPRYIRKGEVYLTTNRGERRVTGSYYTPKYIVDYIVERTITPLLQEASGKVIGLRKQTQARIRQLQAELKTAVQKFPTQLQREHLDESFLRTSDADKTRVEEHYGNEIAKQKRELLAPFFEIRILDPSMGSGHFLVGAADFVSLYLATEPNLYEPIDIGCGKEEDPQLFYKRLVVERCLYGVDINPLAVELAKLSLWLHTVSKERALSFLDHHLRCGNSLVGAQIDRDLSGPPPVLLTNGKRKKVKNSSSQTQFGFAEVLKTRQLDRFLRTFHEIAEKPGGVAAFEREKHHMFADMDHQRHRYRQVANLWVAAYFGLKVSAELYEKTVHTLENGTTEDWVELARDPMFQEAQTIAAFHHFFHWELEFPDVFLEGSESERKFSVVIGNPPYVRQESLGSELKNYFESTCASYAGTTDLYVYFIEAGHEKLHVDGRFGMITSNKYMRANYGKSIRSYLARRAVLDCIIDFGELPVFEQAATFPSILITSRAGQEPEGQSFTYAPVKSLQFESIETEIAKVATILDERALAGSGWSLSSTGELAVFEKMRQNSIPLGEYVGGEIYYGIKTGLNEAFVIDGETRRKLIEADPGSTELIKPFVVGDDIRKYRIDRKDKWLIFTRRGIQINEYPAIRDYLSQFREQLEPRPFDWDVKKNKKWPGRKPGNYQWYEIQDAVDYYEKFVGPKIITPDLCIKNRFTIDKNSLFSADTTTVISRNDPALLTLLNSNLVWYFFEKKCSILGDSRKRGRIRLKLFYLKDIPIPHALQGSDLAELAKQMLDLNKELQAEQKGFLGWLHHSFEVDCDSLQKHRNKLIRYEEGDFHAFIKSLRANAGQLSIDPASRSFQEQVRVEFEQSVGRIRQLQGRMESTDRRINELVYEIYNLTPEEIAVVEASQQGR